MPRGVGEYGRERLVVGLNSAEGKQQPSRLIDALITHWACWEEHEAFYLTKLAPALVENPESGDETEVRILRELRSHLRDAEWANLPQIIADRRAGIVHEIESEKLAREARESARQQEEQERAEAAAQAEQERIRQKRIQEEAGVRKRSVVAEIDQQFQRDFLSTDAFFDSIPSGILSREEYEALKLAFVRRWFDQTAKNRTDRKFQLDDEQIGAIAAVNGNVQVVARAGSGKTATLVNRALFLLQHCRVPAPKILLLAFNRKAAVEIRRRLLGLIHAEAEHQVKSEINERHQLAKQRKVNRIDWSEIEADSVGAVATRLKINLPHVMTFHALAYAIVHPDESILYNGAEGESQGLSRAFQSVIDDHLQAPKYRAAIRELMLAHFKEDWDRIVAKGYDQSKAEFLRIRRSLPRESLRGEYVKSYGEKLIADFLFEHDIAYKYERNHWWNDVNYRPDFTVFKTAKSGLIIEYFGLSGDPDYDAMSADKRAYWAGKADWTLIEFSPSDITSRGDEGFKDLLKHHLEDQGVECHRLSEDEIWLKTRDRAIDRFTTAAVNFVGRCRKLSLSPEELRDRIDAYSPLSQVEAMFLDLLETLYSAYLKRLSATGEEDFDGLMQRAATIVASGATKFQRKSGSGNLGELQFVCIDEFQDFSDLFFRLLQSIRKANPGVGLFCVGDDWQAINGFAGSDLRFFDRFEEHIGPSHRLYIATNYRSAKSVVDAGNALMAGFGKPASANRDTLGTVVLADASEFRPSLIEKQRHPGDIITPMVSRISGKSLASGSDVVLLCRRNSLPWFVNFGDQGKGEGRGLEGYIELMRSLFPKGVSDHITISTAHRYKGLEKPTVIVVDAVARSYPLIHPDWVFSRVLGDSPEKIIAEERRLLYVAMTRAAEKLVIITDGQSRSPFLDELQKVRPLENIEWRDYPSVRNKVSRLVIKVGNQDRRGGGGTFAIKDQLRASGYQWQTTGWPGWAKTCLVDGFQISSLQTEVWVDSADAVEIRIFDEAEQTLGIFRVNGGEWMSVHNELDSMLADASGRTANADEDSHLDAGEPISRASGRGIQS
ncbi:MAG: DNA helicase UvrD [Betaproteobacteria bacterium]|nr:DNA helicase UvrD [Betaproteobacteria bacterium]